MITGIHALIYSAEADEVREFFRDTLGLASVDAGGGWPISPCRRPNSRSIPRTREVMSYISLCDDLHATMADLMEKGVEFSRPVAEESWGLVTAIRLSAETEVPLYQPRHPSPLTPP